MLYCILSLPLIPRWHIGPPPGISISSGPSPVYWQSPMLILHLSVPLRQISTMLFCACPSYASHVESTLVPLLPGCCSAFSEHDQPSKPSSLDARRNRFHVTLLLSRSSFLIFSGQKIFLMRRRHFVWNVSSFFQISFVFFQHSDP